MVSGRNLLNIFHADGVGCHIIIFTNDILKKLSLVGKDLEEDSLETDKMFYDVGRKAGYSLRENAVKDEHGSHS
jgi:transaldolase